MLGVLLFRALSFWGLEAGFLLIELLAFGVLRLAFCSSGLLAFWGFEAGFLLVGSLSLLGF